MKSRVNATEVAKLYDQFGSNQAVADQLGTSEATVRRALKRAEKEGWARPRIQPIHDITLEEPLRHNLQEGSLAVTADYHFPTTDYTFLNQFLREADERKVGHLAIAGDWWNQDFWSRFDFKQDSAGAEHELTAGNAAMKRVLEQFDHVYFTWGNHDARVHKLLGYKVPFATAMKMVFYDLSSEQLSRIEFSNLDHMYVDTFEYADPGPDQWYICHPKAYSRRPLTTAMELASIMNTNIMVAHSHHHAYGWDRSGRLRLVEVGGFFDRLKVQYLQRTDTYPHWTNGYSFLTEDNAVLLRGKGVSYDGT